MSGFATDWDRRRLGFATGNKGLRIARVLYGFALDPLRPGPFPLSRTDRRIGAGLAAVACALGVLYWLRLHRGGIGGAHRCVCTVGSALSALQIGLFTLLVWVPIVAAGSKDAFQWSETVVSWALTAGAWVVADSYRSVPWLAVNER